MLWQFHPERNELLLYNTIKSDFEWLKACFGTILTISKPLSNMTETYQLNNSPNSRWKSQNSSVLFYVKVFGKTLN